MDDLDRFLADIAEVLELERARRRRLHVIRSSTNRVLAGVVEIGLETADERVIGLGGKALTLLQELQEVAGGG